MKDNYCTHPQIDRFKLIRTFRRMQSEPFKIFTASELNDNSSRCERFRHTHLATLIKLGLIEEVSVLVSKGKGEGYRQRIKGYRYNPEKQVPQNLSGDLEVVSPSSKSFTFLEGGNAIE